MSLTARTTRGRPSTGCDCSICHPGTPRLDPWAGQRCRRCGEVYLEDRQYCEACRGFEDQPLTYTGDEP